MASGLALSLIAAAANAADAPLVRKAPVLAPSFDWSGFYTGGHVGYGRGSTRSTLSDPASPDGVNTFGSLYGGVQAGYNYVFPSRFLLGIEGDVSVAEFFEEGTITRRPTTLDSEVSHQVDYIATLRARFGYVFGNTMVYGTGGFATALTRYLEEPGPVIPRDKILRQHFGWSAGAGAEFALSPDWTARVEYLYAQPQQPVGRVPVRHRHGCRVRSAHRSARPQSFL